eukprot:357995-Chlamydomonas_euryale.AAC.1
MQQDCVHLLSHAAELSFLYTKVRRFMGSHAGTCYAASWTCHYWKTSPTYRPCSAWKQRVCFCQPMLRIKRWSLLTWTSDVVYQPGTARCDVRFSLAPSLAAGAAAQSAEAAAASAGAGARRAGANAPSAEAAAARAGARRAGGGAPSAEAAAARAGARHAG